MSNCLDFDMLSFRHLLDEPLKTSSPCMYLIRAQKKCDRNIDMRAINSKAGIWRRGNERNHLGLYLCEPPGDWHKRSNVRLSQRFLIGFQKVLSTSPFNFAKWSEYTTKIQNLDLKINEKIKDKNRVQSLSSSMKTHAERKDYNC